MLLFVCNGRGKYSPVDVSHKIFQIKSIITDDEWQLLYKIPFSFFLGATCFYTLFTKWKEKYYVFPKYGKTVVIIDIDNNQDCILTLTAAAAGTA